MKVCIIGTNGFLATAIGQCLSDIDGCEILACGRTAPSEYEFTAFKKIDINALDKFTVYKNMKIKIKLKNGVEIEEKI